MQKFQLSLLKSMRLFLLFSFLSVFFTSCKKEDLLPPIPTGPDSGEGMFWTASDLGCGNITVTIGGISKVITSYYNTTIPDCTASGAATFNLTPGTYSYTASCPGLSWNGSITITANGCTKIQLTGSGGGGGGGGSTGQGMFWIASDLGCGNITVVCNGITRTISSVYGSAPACGASGTATFDFSPGTYSYSASCSGKNWSGTITITAGGCQKVQLTSSGGGGGGGSTGQGMFWIASDLGCGNITVVCNGISRTISSVYGSAPACGASGTATFNFSPGTYSYTASCSGKNWSGTITITAGGCQKVQLTSSGGGSTTGQLTFWIRTDLGCGNINVTCNGVTRTITQYYSSGAPNCGATGCANFTLNPGTYSFTASCNGRTWSGNNTVTSGGCQMAELY
jgi:major membrane immunogen (membrane-anchored lipoprotein)